MSRLRLPRLLHLKPKSLKILSRNISNKKDDSIDSIPVSQDVTKINSSGDESGRDDRPTVSVTVIGGGLTIGYTALLLKQEPIIKRINVLDVGGKAVGLLLDAGQIDTSTKIKYFKKNNISEAVRNVDVIALMNEDDFTYGKSSSHAQFLASSRYVKNIAEKLVQSCPTALVAVFAQPVTANVPLVSEIYKFAGWWDPDRIIGSLAIDSMRLDSMAANLYNLNPAFTSIPIAGGADPCTIVPLLSQARPVNQFSIVQQKSLVRSLRASDNELAIVNECRGGPKLTIAAAATKLIITLANGYCGFKNCTASAYVRSNVLPMCRFFANELQFGPDGVRKNFGLPKISASEIELIEQAIPIINANTDLAMKFIYEKRKTRLNSM